MDGNDKLNLGDITFDDVLGDGLDIEQPVDTADADDKQPEDDKPVDQNPAEPADDKEKPADPVAKEKPIDPLTRGEEEPAGEEAPQDSEPETPGADTEGDSIVGEILTGLGFDSESSEYEDSSEGLMKMTKDVANYMAEEQLDNLFNQHPIIKQHLEYVLAGGDSKQFMALHDPRKEYSSVTLNEDDTAMQKSVLSEYFKVKGHEQDFIEDMLNDYEDSGKLFAKAEKAKEALEAYQVKEREQAMAAQKQEQENAAKEQQQFWNEVYDTVQNSNDLAGIALPEVEKQKFFDYISKPVTKEGYTQRDLDHMQSDMKTKLAVDYLLYSKFDLTKAVETKAKTSRAKSLKERLGKQKAQVKNAERPKRSGGSVDLDELDLGTIL